MVLDLIEWLMNNNLSYAIYYESYYMGHNLSYNMAHVKLNSLSHKINSDVIFESRMTLLRCIFWVILIEYEFHINYRFGNTEHRQNFDGHKWPISDRKLVLKYFISPKLCFSTNKEEHLEARLMRVKANVKNLRQKV